VLEDVSGKMTPRGWAHAAIAAYERHRADAVIVERNFGGDMVESNLRQCGFDGRIIETFSSRGKVVRAEPVVGLYEQGKVHHVGILEALEAEQTEWVPGESASPNRVDAEVFGMAELSKGRSKAQVSSPVNLPNNVVPIRSIA
jgi:phage terminase large subunit-like protein